IQNLGIVPDIQLQPMYVPTKNDAPSDFVRMLSPTHTYGEKDLDAHLVSTYAKDGEKPQFEIPFLYEKKKTPAADVKTSPPDDSVATSPAGPVNAGDVVNLTATVKNTGSGPAWRVLSRVQAEDPVFEDTELPIGKIGPGEIKTFTTKLQIPKDALDRVSRLGL